MTTSRYQPKFPRTIAGEGFNYRRVLDSPRCERLSKQMDHTYRNVDLEPDDRFALLELHRELIRGYYAVASDRQFPTVQRFHTWRLKGPEMVKAVEAAYAEFLGRINATALDEVA